MNLLERIDQWARVAPDAIAHLSGDRALTYGELGARSNALAAVLQDRHGASRAPVAVLGHREPEMLIGFLGVAKSGRAYIPIDTSLPNERVKHIVDLAQPSEVLTPEQIAKLPPNESAFSTPRCSNDPFYIIFTSGSTGTPKGIVITLANLEHFVGWMSHEQKFTERGEVFLNQAPFSFDLSVMDLYCSLTSGSALFSLSRDLISNPKSLFAALARSGTTTWVSTPSFAEMCLVERKFDHAMLPKVRRFLFCGEVLLAKTARELLSRFPAAEVWNFYGPTEATVATTSVKIDIDKIDNYTSLPVGRAMPGTEISLVDREIVISGPNVSPGYLHGNDARFFSRNGVRAYRTGDLGSFRDGLLFYEGRIDDQIKLNGYRIELGDIETNLRAIDSVRDAVVIPVAPNGKAQWLAAFVVASSETEMNAIRDALRDRVPAYMMPRKFLRLDAFPMTPNGKIDKNKLAALL